jgi:hypothetical protein
MRAVVAAAALAILAARSAAAVPLAAEEITKLCTDAEGPSHCMRLVEAQQLKRLPGLATRDGNTLRVTLFPKGATTFEDVDTLSGGTSYALWDYISELNAVVLWTMRDDDAGFLLLQRATGRRTPLPAEPVLGPDRQRFATADFCEARCENRLVVWRVTRESVAREAEWQPAEPWADAGVRWKDADTLVVEHTPVGAPAGKTLERRLGEPGWVRGAPR